MMPADVRSDVIEETAGVEVGLDDGDAVGVKVVEDVLLVGALDALEEAKGLDEVDDAEKVDGLEGGAVHLGGDKAVVGEAVGHLLGAGGDDGLVVLEVDDADEQRVIDAPGALQEEAVRL